VNFCQCKSYINLLWIILSLSKDVLICECRTVHVCGICFQYLNYFDIFMAWLHVLNVEFRVQHKLRVDAFHLQGSSVWSSKLQIKEIQIRFWDWSNEPYHVNICCELVNHVACYKFQQLKTLTSAVEGTWNTMGILSKLEVGHWR
jgi:hypothetical protein